MIRVIPSTSSAAARSYYSSGLSRGDYYSQQQESPGLWGGKGAERLGLSGRVEQAAFTALTENLHPQTGEKLTPRFRADRTVGYDINFHVPKSVSIVHALTGDERILLVFEQAAHETMLEMEAEARTRVRKSGADSERVTGNLIWAGFTHRTARPVDGVPDPHLHRHYYVFNATYDEVEGTWKAGQFRELKHDAPYYEAAFLSRLAMGLQELGYGIRRRQKSFELQGVSNTLINRFSRRTRQIEETAQALGVVDPRQKALLGAATRKGKRLDLTPEQLIDSWKQRLTEAEWTDLNDLREAARKHAKLNSREVGASQDQVLHIQARQQAIRAAEVEAVQYAMAHGFERESVMEEKRFLELALRHGVGVLTVSNMHELLPKLPDLVRREVVGRKMLTTRQVLAEEQEIIDFVRQGQGVLRPMSNMPIETLGGGVGDAVGGKTRPALNTEQLAAVRHVLGSTDRVTGIRGISGAGKTTLMKVAIPAIETAGSRVMVLAPTAVAARENLGGEGFAQAETVAKFLMSDDLQAQYRQGVWWVDEAGLLSTPAMHALFKAAEEHDARIVLMGDTRQHRAVERGDALRILEGYSGIQQAALTTIQRQKGLYREAVEDLHQKRYAQGFEKLLQMGAIHEEESNTRYQKLAESYVKAVQAGESALIISPTHHEGRLVAQTIRQQLKEAGEISKERAVEVLRQIDLNEADRADPRSYQGGWVIEFVQNVTGFRAGERVTVMEDPVTEDHQLRVVRSAGHEAVLNVRTAVKRLQVYEPEELQIGIGEPIRYTRNGRSAEGRFRITNGSFDKVVGFTDHGDLRVASGKAISREFKHIAHGCVSTSYAAQGMSVDRLYLAQSMMSLGAMSDEQFFVSIGRGRKSLEIYTDDREELMQAVRRSSARMSASDLQRLGEQAKLKTQLGKSKEVVLQPLPEVILRQFGKQAKERTQEEERSKKMPARVLEQVFE